MKIKDQTDLHHSSHVAWTLVGLWSRECQAWPANSTQRWGGGCSYAASLGGWRFSIGGGGLVICILRSMMSLKNSSLRSLMSPKVTWSGSMMSQHDTTTCFPSSSWLIPFPRLHFFMTRFAPRALTSWFAAIPPSPSRSSPNRCSMPRTWCVLDPRHDRYLTTTSMFRGRMRPRKSMDTCS